MGKRKRRTELTMSMSGEESGRSNRRRGGRGDGGRGRRRGGRRQYYGGRHVHRDAINMPMQPQSSNPLIDVDSLPDSVAANVTSAATSSSLSQDNPLIDANALPVAAPNVVSATTSRSSSTITMDSETAPTIASASATINVP